MPVLEILVPGLLALVALNTVTSLAVVRRLRPPAHRRDEPLEGAMDPASAADLPSVSVLVPARNEAGRIGQCLLSLERQGPVIHEIIVLDDGSDDGTADVVLEAGFREAPGAGRLLLRGRPLPSGWSGKGWACHQLAEAATGEILVFIDADTRLEPGCLPSAAAHCRRHGIGLLTLWPRQVVRTWAERLVVPLMIVLAMAFAPHGLAWIAGRFPRLFRWMPRGWVESLATANGQFLCFSRETYDAVGGHRAVRHHLVEDVALARRVLGRSVHEGGGLLENGNGSGSISCRMYRSLGELWEGFSKNVRAAFGRSTAGFVAFGAIQIATMLAPFAWCVLAPGPASWTAVGLVAAIRILLASAFPGGWWSVLLHVPAYVLAVIIALNSWRLHAAGRLRWKGRTYRPNLDGGEGERDAD